MSVLDDVEILAVVAIHRVLQRIAAHIALHEARQTVLQQREKRVVVHDHLRGLRLQLRALALIHGLAGFLDERVRLVPVEAGRLDDRSPSRWCHTLRS